MSDSIDSVQGSCAPAAIAPLPLLPVFLQLSGRDVLISGASQAAVWKAELAQAARARLWLRCAPGSALHAWFAQQSDKSGLQWLDPASVPPSNAACWICEAEDELVAVDLQRHARACGVPLNLIDRPQFSDFQFGSVINRAPLLVSISTAGVAPVLGQALRQRIETLLPSGLAGWLQAARTLRSKVSAQFTTGPLRRDFWQRFAARALREDCSAAAVEELLDPRFEPAGAVALVGAGPGDPGLLTLNAVRALQNADVILFDDLVSDGVLELARREAKRMLVGKRGRRPSCQQEEITALMIKLARAGKQVVRLKGGDPGVFGRAGEELAALRAAGIACRVVPGITAALAMAAAFGVSLTHRDHAQSLQFVTGHARDGRLPARLNWQSLADPRSTTVYYMGAGTIREIVELLRKHGLDADTPALWVANLSRTDERRWSGRLSGLADSIGAHELNCPLLIGIGRVFADVHCSVDAQPRIDADADADADAVALADEPALGYSLRA